MTFGGVAVDKCFACGGLWLDDGELETLQKKDSGFVGKMLNVFRS
jgi:Zn-finger nucleic acid-binding protein